MGGTIFKSKETAFWLGMEKERRISELCKGHFNKVVETVSEMRKNVHAICDIERKKAEETFKRVFEREREADEIKRKIVGELSKGLIHPINREEVMRLVLTADDIATNAKAAVRRLKLISSAKISPTLKKGLKEISDFLLQISELTRSAYFALLHNPQGAIELANEVERIEEKIDDFRIDEILPSMVSWSDKSSSSGHAMMIKDAIDNMEKIADCCEDVVDVIRGIVLSQI